MEDLRLGMEELQLSACKSFHAYMIGVKNMPSTLESFLKDIMEGKEDPALLGMYGVLAAFLLICVINMFYSPFKHLPDHRGTGAGAASSVDSEPAKIIQQSPPGLITRNDSEGDVSALTTTNTAIDDVSTKKRSVTEISAISEDEAENGKSQPSKKTAISTSFGSNKSLPDAFTLPNAFTVSENETSKSSPLMSVPEEEMSKSGAEAFVPGAMGMHILSSSSSSSERSDRQLQSARSVFDIGDSYVSTETVIQSSITDPGILVGKVMI